MKDKSRRSGKERSPKKKRGSLVADEVIGSSTDYTSALRCDLGDATANANIATPATDPDIISNDDSASASLHPPTRLSILRGAITNVIINIAIGKKTDSTMTTTTISDDMGDIEGTLGALAATRGAYDESLLLSNDDEDGSSKKPTKIKKKASRGISRDKDVAATANSKNKTNRSVEENYHPPYIKNVSSFLLGGKTNDDDDDAGDNDDVAQNNQNKGIELTSVSPYTDISRSSMMCYSETGAVQMNLPQDKVRLIMDSDVEAGTLFIVAGDDDQAVNDDGFQSNGHRPLVQSLNYALTVDDDLYRRVVKEMADSRCPCGLYYCCHETDNKVNIWVAIGILSVILVFLFVNTMIWPVSR